MNREIYIDDFQRISIYDVREKIGGRRRLNSAESVIIHLTNGLDVPVYFHRLPANIGGGSVTYLSCPGGCGRPVSVVRVVPSSPWLLCRNCIRKVYSARYLSQSHRISSSLPAVSVC